MEEGEEEIIRKIIEESRIEYELSERLKREKEFKDIERAKDESKNLYELDLINRRNLNFNQELAIQLSLNQNLIQNDFVTTDGISKIQNYHSTSNLLLGKPLPPIPDRYQKLNYNHRQTSNLSVSNQYSPYSDNHSTIPSSSQSFLNSNSISTLSSSLSSSSSSCYEFFQPENQFNTLNSPITSSQDCFTLKNHNQQQDETKVLIPSTINLTITTCSSPVPSQTCSPITDNFIHSSNHNIKDDQFDVNPPPPENVIEGIQFGKIQSLNDQLGSVGQFPNVIQLSQFLKGSPTKIQNPLLSIQAWSWNRLLTYLMWHGNSRVEPGPLDITEAEDEHLGSWLAGMSVIFKQGEGETSVRLILELIPGNGDSQWSRNEFNLNNRRHSSVSIGNIKRDQVIIGSQTPQVIHLPKPYLNLPIQLSTLACNLHEIHSVSRMTSSIHTGITCSFKSNKNKNSNMFIYNKLSKAIESNSKLLNETNEENFETDKFMERGKNWFKKKKIKLVSSSSSSSSSSSMTTHTTTYHHNHTLNLNSNLDTLQSNKKNHYQDKKKFSKVSKIDGSGLPLPDGATMVRPWDSDWS